MPIVRLALGRGANPGAARARVLIDVLVHRREELESVVLAHHLQDRRHRIERRSRRAWIGHLDFVLVGGIDEIGPALRLGHLLLGQQLGVVAPAQHTGVDRRLEVLVLLGDPLRPVVQLGDVRRLVRFEQTFGGELLGRRRLGRMVDVGARIAPLGANLREALAVGPADEDRLLARSSSRRSPSAPRTSRPRNCRVR